MSSDKVFCQQGIGGRDITRAPGALPFPAHLTSNLRRGVSQIARVSFFPRAFKVYAVVQNNPKVSAPRKEPPWYNGKFNILSSNLARWMTTPGGHEWQAREVVKMLWTGMGNVSSLRASEAAQCVAFRAAALRAMYGALPEVRIIYCVKLRRLMHWLVCCSHCIPGCCWQT
jgi:hypothetical protein